MIVGGFRFQTDTMSREHRNTRGRRHGRSGVRATVCEYWI